MKYALQLALAPAFVCLAACNPENQEQYAYTPSSARVAAMPPDTPRFNPIVRLRAESLATRAPSSTLAIALRPVVPGAASGAATLASAGGETRVTTRVQGGVPGRHYSGVIRRGTCARPGPEVAWLTPASTDTLGAARAVSFARVELRRLTSAPHVVIYGEGGRPELCGELSVAG